MSEPIDLAEVTFIKRIVVGNNDPQKIQDDAAVERQLQFLNHCLSDYPKGKIIGQEKCFNLLRIGEHQVVMQYIVYHVGFKRKPQWVDEQMETVS